MSKIHFHYTEKPVFVSKKKELKSFIETLFSKENKTLERLDYIFCNDEYLIEINKQYLNHDFYTDIITFDLSNNPKKIIGEIYISTERVEDNAKKLKESFKNEIHRVIFHGALHLCGYKDKTTSEEKNMRLMEEKYISQYFI